MLTSTLTSILAYISTNLDDIFILMLLLAQLKNQHRIIAGHFLGVGLLTGISILGALGLQNVPVKYAGILGLVPIGLGIRAWFDRNDGQTGTNAVGVLSMAVITICNGADNIGVYIPLFTGFSAAERIGAVIVFAAMTVLWVWLAKALAEFPRVKAFLQKYKSCVIPVMFIVLGVFIILDSGLIG